MLVKCLNGDILTFDTEDNLAAMLNISPGRNLRMVLETIDDGCKMVMMVPDRQATPEETERLETYLRTEWDIFDQFRTALIEADAIVVGGAILSAFFWPEWPLQDIDVFVRRLNAPSLLLHLLSQQYTVTVPNRLPLPYDERSPWIWMRLLLRSSIPQQPPIDLFILYDNDDDEDISAAVQSALSCCECWWDGRSVFSNDLHALRNRCAVFQPEKASLDSIERLQRYRNMGVDIEDMFHIVLPLGEIFRSSTHEEDWAIRTFLAGARLLLHTPDLPYEGFVLCVYPPKMTYESLIQSWGETLVQTIAGLLVISDEMEVFFARLPSQAKTLFESLFPSCCSSYPQDVWMNLGSQLAELLPPLLHEWELRWNHLRSHLNTKSD